MPSPPPDAPAPSLQFELKPTPSSGTSRRRGLPGDSIFGKEIIDGEVSHLDRQNGIGGQADRHLGFLRGRPLRERNTGVMVRIGDDAMAVSTEVVNGDPLLAGRHFQPTQHFRYANFRYANFRYANFRYANFRYANFRYL
jgi:hypothetical protein